MKQKNRELLAELAAYRKAGEEKEAGEQERKVREEARARLASKTPRPAWAQPTGPSRAGPARAALCPRRTCAYYSVNITT